MPIYATNQGGGGDFELCPAGVQQLVCCDIVDHGNVKVQYGDKIRHQHKITIRWLSGENKTQKGEPCLVQRRFTCSLHPKAALRLYLDIWRGKAFTEEEAKLFDLERLIGANGLGNVVHQQKPRGTFAEVLAVMPLLRGMTIIAVDPKYIRVKDRPKDSPPGDHSTEPPADPTIADYDDSEDPSDRVPF